MVKYSSILSAISIQFLIYSSWVPIDNQSRYIIYPSLHSLIESKPFLVLAQTHPSNEGRRKELNAWKR